MLPPLDPRKLHALSLEGDIHEDDDFDPNQDISDIRELIAQTEDSDWAWGVVMIMWYGKLPAMVQGRKMMSIAERRVSDDWWIDFLVCECYFISLVGSMAVDSLSSTTMTLFLSRVLAVSLMFLSSRDASPLFKSWDVVRIGRLCSRASGIITIISKC